MVIPSIRTPRVCKLIMSGKLPLDLGIPSLRINHMLESKP